MLPRIADAELAGHELGEEHVARCGEGAVLFKDAGNESERRCNGRLHTNS